MKTAGPSSRTPLSSLARTSATDGLRISVEEIPRETIQKRFPVGSTLGARILETLGENRYLVGFGGMKFVAESNLELPAGARLGLQVAAHEPKLHLKILRNDAQALDEALKRLGFEKPTEEGREILSRLFEKELPVDRETVRKAQDLMRKGFSAREAVRLLANNLPSGESFARRAHLAEGSVAEALKRLETALESAGRKGEAASLRASLEFRGSLAELVETHPLGHERRILGEKAAEALRDGKTLLLELAKSALDPRAGEAEREAGRAAQELLETLEGRFLCGEPEPQIPFVVEDGGDRDGWLAARRAPERTNLRFRLETSALGEVVGVVDFTKRQVGIALGVGTPEARKALAGARPELHRALEELGFNLESATVDVLAPRGESEATARPVVGLDLKI